jgi:hypothetical protein
MDVDAFWSAESLRFPGYRFAHPGYTCYAGCDDNKVLILPDRQIAQVRHAESARRVNRPQGAALRHTPDTSHIDAVPHPQEGRFAIVTNVGCGMQWTQATSTDE